MIKTIIKKSTENTMLTFGTDVAHQVTDALANKYGFDSEEAKKFLGTINVSISSSNSSVKQKSKVPTVPLPFCGKIEDTWCQAIKSNHKMFTQCRNDKVDGIFCKGCATNAKKNDGKPIYGLITERLVEDYTDKNGKKPKNYGNVMKTLEITREAAEAEANKLGWTIPEEQFEVVEVKKGRPKKNTTSSSKSNTKVKEEKEDIVLSAFNRSSSSTLSEDEQYVVDKPKRRKSSKSAKKKASVVTSDTSDEDTNPSKKNTRTKKKEHHDEEKINKKSDAIEDTSKLSDDEEENINNEITTDVKEVTEVTDCDGNIWFIDDENNAYDEQENFVGKWDNDNNEVIRQYQENNNNESDNESEISDISSDEED